VALGPLDDACPLMRCRPDVSVDGHGHRLGLVDIPTCQGRERSVLNRRCWGCGVYVLRTPMDHCCFAPGPSSFNPPGRRDRLPGTAAKER